MLLFCAAVNRGGIMRKTFKAFAIASALALGFPAATALAAETASSSQSGSTVCFVLREEGDKLALYREDIAEPLAVYDAPLGGLTAADAELLREGIRIKTRAEAMRLIEDFGAE